MIVNPKILQEVKTELKISGSRNPQESIDCTNFLSVLDSFVLKEKSISQSLSEQIINSVLEIVSTEEDSYQKEDLEFYNILCEYCFPVSDVKSEIVEKRINRNLSRIAKRRWVRYRQKYLRALKDAQESFNTKPCQKNIRDLLKKESYSREDIFTLLKAMNSSLTHYVIFNELSEKVSGETLPQELLLELNELNSDLFQEGYVILESKNEKEFKTKTRDLVALANEIFVDVNQQTNFLDE